MRKLCLILVLLLVFQIPAYAAVTSLNWADKAVNDQISVNGTAAPGELVTIIILNPDKTFLDFTSSAEAVRHEATQYVGYTTAKNDGSFEKIVKIDKAGIFTVIANGVELTPKLEFYPESAKKHAVIDYESGTIDYKELVRTFGLSNNAMYKANEQNVGDTIALLELDENNIVATSGLLETAFLLSYYNSGRSDLIFSGNNIVHKDIIGIASDGKEYNDYLNSLNDNGVAKVKKALTNPSPKFTKFSDIVSRFNEQIYINIIMNNKLDGYGHIQPAFARYSSEYKAAGVNYPAIENKALYLQLLASGADTLAKINTELGKEVSESTSGNVNNNTSSTIGSTPSFGGGGGGGGGSATVVKPDNDDTTQAPDTAPDTGDDNGSEDGSFTDIDDTHWAYDAISALSSKGIINGYNDSSYKPEQTVTRAEFAKMLVGVMGLDISSKLTNFTDITSNDWYTPYIAAAAKAGYISGYNGMFRANDIISRQDAAIILARAAGISANGSTSFADHHEISDYAKDAAAAVEEHGLMNGTGGGRFEPLSSLTRAQAATVLYRLLERSGQ